jgi:hypothetical protein
MLPFDKRYEAFLAASPEEKPVINVAYVALTIILKLCLASSSKLRENPSTAIALPLHPSSLALPSIEVYSSNPPKLPVHEPESSGQENESAKSIPRKRITSAETGAVTNRENPYSSDAPQQDRTTLAVPAKTSLHA